jgi:hypothetical protein
VGVHGYEPFNMANGAKEVLLFFAGFFVWDGWEIA